MIAGVGTAGDGEASWLLPLTGRATGGIGATPEPTRGAMGLAPLVLPARGAMRVPPDAGIAAGPLPSRPVVGIGKMFDDVRRVPVPTTSPPAACWTWASVFGSGRSGT